MHSRADTQEQALRKELRYKQLCFDKSQDVQKEIKVSKTETGREAHDRGIKECLNSEGQWEAGVSR